MKTFESARAPIQQGIKYKRKAIIAGGLAITAYYLSARRDTRKAPAEDFTGAPVHPTTSVAATRDGDRSRKR